ncbi:DNA/RNA helicase [Weissella confusa]|uniref:SNF2-related protein n=1 Tax=Weissella confusa TaxID=1583 RepID=UPI0021B00A57|nr:SNF2-related protein [Weissella confusa]MCS9992176.1 DNA/RNA helicase [Weissella confusa]
MLKDIDLKPGYTTPEDDIGKSFYSKALEQSTQYDRVTGYFTSGALLYYTKGIQGLLANGGKFRLIMSAELPEDDYNAIKLGYLKREQRQQVEELVKDANVIDATQLSNVAYLVEIGLLDIKVGFVPNGLFHAKYGVISDAEGNSVYFSGSFNETANAFANNFERIDLQTSWTSDGIKSYIDRQKENFESLWETESDGMVFLKEFNDLLKSQLITYSKGKFIMDSALLTDDSLILYLGENSQLKVQDNLVSKTVDPEQRRIRSLRKEFMIDEQLWNFRTGLTYADIETIIRQLNGYATREQIKFVVSRSVEDFIESMKFEIDEISKRGLMIKDESPEFLDDLNHFKEIVNQETVRELREIQSWVSFDMTTMKRTGNFSVPGAGKTAMMYGTFAYLSAPSNDLVDKLVVIGPKSSFLAWKDEFRAMFGDKRTLNVLDVQSKDFRKEQFYRNVGQYNLILVNYESVMTYATELRRIIDSKTMIVYDEIHKIKAVGGMRASAAIPLAEQATYRYALTGTPIPNSYQDIYNMLIMLFRNEYASYFGYSPAMLKQADSVMMSEINEKIYPFYWRVTKKQLGVPEANPDHIVELSATDDEQRAIDLLWSKYRKMPFKLYIRLIQLASNPGLLTKSIVKSMFAEDGMDSDGEGREDVQDDLLDEPSYSYEELETLNRIQKSSKFEKSIELIEDLISKNKHPVVWAIFVDTIDKLASRLSAKGAKVAVVYGQTPPEERERIIKGVQAGLYDVLITNPHTLAESVSLHKNSHAAVYVEYSFNLTHMLQSRDRIHRLGLEEGTETDYYYLELRGQENQQDTIDAKIYTRLDEKKNIMLDAIEGTQLAPMFDYDEKAEILEMMHSELRSR